MWKYQSRIEAASACIEKGKIWGRKGSPNPDWHGPNDGWGRCKDDPETRQFLLWHLDKVVERFYY